MIKGEINTVKKADFLRDIQLIHHRLCMAHCNQSKVAHIVDDERFMFSMALNINEALLRNNGTSAAHKFVIGMLAMSNHTKTMQRRGGIKKGK